MPEPERRTPRRWSAPLWLRQALFVAGILALPAWLALCPVQDARAPGGGSLLSPCGIGVLLIALLLAGLALLGDRPPRR